MAAEQGYAPAQHNPGYMHQSREEMPEDHVDRFSRHDLAAAQNYNDAWEKRDKPLNLMTPDQVAGAQELSNELRAQISVN